MTQFGNLPESPLPVEPIGQPDLEPAYYPAAPSVPSDPLLLQLQQEVVRLSSALQSLQSNATPSRAPPSSPKIRLPEKFRGERTRFRGFMLQLELAFSLRPEDYSSDSAKISTFGTLLEGKALSWFTPFLEKGLHLQTTWENFRTLVSATFDDPCRKLSAEAKLQHLVQTNSLSDYISDFNALSAEVDWNEATLISHFRRGLNSTILDMMVAHEVPTTLNELFDLANRIENRIWETKQLKKGKTATTRPTNDTHRSHRFATPITTPTPKKDPFAMEIDAIRRGPLSKHERDNRFRLGLCLYCGSPDHRLSNCTKKQSKSLNSIMVRGPEAQSSGKVNGQ
jgi:hypothetical protein